MVIFLKLTGRMSNIEIVVFVIDFLELSFGFLRSRRTFKNGYSSHHCFIHRINGRGDLEATADAKQSFGFGRPREPNLRLK